MLKQAEQDLLNARKRFSEKGAEIRVLKEQLAKLNNAGISRRKVEKAKADEVEDDAVPNKNDEQSELKRQNDLLEKLLRELVSSRESLEERLTNLSKSTADQHEQMVSALSQVQNLSQATNDGLALQKMELEIIRHAIAGTPDAQKELAIALR